MTYARTRLWLGMTSVGGWVVLSLAGIIWNWGAVFQGLAEQYHELIGLAAFFGAYLLITFIPDLLGGWVLPNKYERRVPPFGQWLGKWLRASLIHASYLLLAAYLLLVVGKTLGTWAAVALMVVHMLFMTRMQYELARLIAPLFERGELKEKIGLKFPGMRFVFVDAPDPGFTGGIAGGLRRETILVPNHWQESTKGEMLDVLKARRVGAILSGSRTRGVLLAILWNALLFTLAILLSPEGVATVNGVVTTSFYFTLFSFLGILGFLPELSRRAVFEVDHWVAGKGIEKTKLQEVFSFTDKLQDDEPVRKRIVEFIFHPIPSVESRIQQLFMNKPSQGAWHVARHSLFLSWAGIGLLSRAVHCNVGRPELWVFLPCD
ncbi:MAG: hypothetical protein AAGI38_06955 [Bacteroidota bacterium]